jgi:hypothetical protein
MINQARLAALQRAARVITEPVSLPPPIKGWNTRDAFEAMDPLEAIRLDNWYPDYAGCEIRHGSQVFATTDGVGAVQTLAVWRSGGTSAMIAAVSGQWWDVSAGFGGGRPVIGSGYASDWWAQANFAGRIFLCNGHDGIKVWQGPAIGSGVIEDAGFTIDPLSGFDPAHGDTFNGVYVAHNRLFFWNGNDPGFWYGELLAITGVLTYFPFDRLVPTGAAMVAMSTLTYDGGTGIADYSIFILSTGEMLSYSGTDPSNPGNWALTGVYIIAPPVAPQGFPVRGVFRYGGDVYNITSSDYAKLTQLLAALQAGTMPPRSKVSGAVIEAVGQARHLPGWQAVYWGYRRRLLFNVPLPEGGFVQHVYNPQTDAWCRYTGLPAYCWVVWGDRLFFGAPGGSVIEHGVGSTDGLVHTTQPWDITPWDQEAWGRQVKNPIAAFAQQSWNLFGTPLEKRVSAVRPIMQSSQGSLSFEFSLGFDYRDPSVTVAVDRDAEASPWDTSAWDSSPWSAEFAVDNQWHIAGGNGSVISIAVAATRRNPMHWLRSDLRIEKGSAL